MSLCSNIELKHLLINLSRKSTLLDKGSTQISLNLNPHRMGKHLLSERQAMRLLLNSQHNSNNLYSSQVEV